MDQMNGYRLASKLYKKSLLNAIASAAALSIFFFGYDQGMMGGVNTSADYATLMGYGHVDESTGKVIVDDSLLQGGIVAVYYLGTLVGAFLGGWIGDKTGRIRTIALGAIWAIFGAGLQCSAQNHVWMICARLVNGVGTGILNAIVPVWSTETADHQSRGQFIAIEFTLNIFGVVVAYWMEFGLSFIDGGRGPFQWRFPIAFQIIPLLILFAIIWVFPESPRWLCKVGRDKEARYILGRLRGEEGEDKIRAEAEYRDIINIVQLEKSTSKQNTYWRMLFDFGDQGSGSLHNGRRVQLVVWLQIMQEWCGIAGVTVYAPTIFSIAGYGAQKSAWLSGLNNTTYMFATLICVFTIDRIGRRWTLYWGAAAQAVAMFIVGGMSRGGINASESGNTSLAASYGAAAAFGVFLYTAVFGSTWLTVPWLLPAEIFPLEVRAKGNAYGVIGWSIGNGWLTLLCPVMFDSIGEKTFYIFAAVNVVSIPIVWALYPETSQRTLEEVNILFSAPSPWVWDAEKHFAEFQAGHPSYLAASRGNSMVDAETGLHDGKKRESTDMVESTKHGPHRER